MTAEEFAYAMEFSKEICSYESMVVKGLFVCAGDGYELTEKGIECQKQALRRQE